jgi:hypothetical protein
MNKLLLKAIINAFGTLLYIILIVSFIFSLQHFQKMEDTIFIPIAMLMLFVCSAAITGFLVFGKPVMLYLDGKKKEALSLLGYTIGILFLLTIITFIILISLLV